ncbi:MAG: signal peptide peptidase SppA [Paludibacteraceae bacterium]|nr:signal peptide peptidase SppA [Paludibacteraceae bacterium]
MKQFVKYVLATVVGLALFSFLISFLGLIGLGSLVALSESKNPVLPKSVLSIHLEGNLVDRSQEDIWTLLSSDETLTIGLDDILQSIEAAKKNDDIKGIYLSTGLFEGGYASIAEIRQALLSFKETGKFVIAYSGAYTQKCYYLASVADKVFLNPEGVIDLNGVSSSTLFYKNLLKNIGVDMQVIKVGTYKSFSEQYTNTEMSPANKEQLQVLTSSIWKSLLDDISVSRGIPVDSLDAMASSFVSFQSQEQCLNWNLVDSLCYYDEVETYIGQSLGLDEGEEISILEPKDLLQDDLTQLGGGQEVAVVYAIGEIDNGTVDGINSSELAKTLRELAKNDEVSAVVLRVSSPGGSAYGSEQIWRAVELVKARKPVVVSMGDYAASGGYYLSCGAHRIFAESTTVTGSIGIFCVIPNAEGLMEKIGIDYESVNTNPFADAPNILRPLSDSERRILQEYVNKGYHLFVNRCAEGRNMPYDELEKIAQGRVWSGASALQLNLVDQIGGLDDAIASAAAMANVSDYTVTEYPKKKTLLESLQEKPSLGMDKLFFGTTLKRERDVLERVRKIERMQAILPYELEIQ